ncbi:MAG: hypothetical protein RLZZ450_6130 [Pseudomonadota bacterium]|jgi:PAS domain S-box-containing protein
MTGGKPQADTPPLQRSIKEIERENLYRHFMQAPFPIAVFKGPRHIIELANSQILLGWGKGSEVLGSPLEEALPELRGQPFLGWLDGVLETGVAYEGKEQLARLPAGPNGELADVYCNFVYAPLHDAEGAIEGVLVSAFDVTREVLAHREVERAHREVERALMRAEASEAQFRELVENLPELAWNALPDGYIDFYNRRWYEYTGTTFEKMQGWQWTSVHDPEKVEEVSKRWQASLDSGEPFEMEFRLRRHDGVFRWFLTRVIPFRDADGRIVRWFGTNTDVDDQRRERERAEQLASELSVLSQRLHAAQRAANIGIFDWDIVSGQTTWSPELYGLMGLEPDVIEATPEAWTERLVEHDRQRGWDAFRVAAEARASLMEVEVRLRQPSGAARWVRLSTDIEYDLAGAPTRLIGAVVDVQVLKEAILERGRAPRSQNRPAELKTSFSPR